MNTVVSNSADVAAMAANAGQNVDMNQVIAAVLSSPELVRLVAAVVEHKLEVSSGLGFDLDQLANLSAAVSSSQYLHNRMHGVQRHSSPVELIQFALSKVSIDGLFLEFGVHKGFTLNIISKIVGRKVYGFDSFEGLPEAWRENFGQGTFALEHLPAVNENAELVVGWFDRTLPTFLDTHQGPVAFVHIDSDLYSSAQTVLMQLRGRIVPGTIILFDEYFNYPGWDMHEHKAFQEFVASTGLQYEYIGVCSKGFSVAVRVTGAGLCGRG
jgi:hypothetical protein